MTQVTPELIQRILDDLETTNPLTKHYAEFVLNTIQTFDKKQHDYGPGNIRDTIAEFGIRSIIIRNRDKEARIKNLVGQEKEAVNEPLIDAPIDAGVYFFILAMVIAGHWPGLDPKEIKW